MLLKDSVCETVKPVSVFSIVQRNHGFVIEVPIIGKPSCYTKGQLQRLRKGVK